MLADISIVIAIAVAALAVVVMLFKSVESVPQKKVEASKVLEQATATKKAAPAQQKAQKAKKPTKKELAEQKQKEAEIEALIAKELAAPSRGLATEKYEVETLEGAKAKAKAKKEASKKSAGQAVAAAETKGPSEEQRAKDRAQGFKVVEVKKDDEKPASPASTGNPAKSAGRRGTKKASPTSPAAAKREELEKKLSQFFKGGNRRRRNDDDFAPAAGTSEAKAKLSPTSGVTQKKPISAAGTKTWAEEKEW